jgi:uncharacterized membrane protein YqjE
VASSFDALRSLTAASLNLLLSRAEFASVELAQARAQMMRWLLLALGALLFALLGLVAATALFVVLLWPVLGWVALLLPAIGYLLGAVLVFQRLQREIADAPPLLSDTLQELAKDRDAFRGQAAGAAVQRADEQGRESP